MRKTTAIFLAIVVVTPALGSMLVTPVSAHEGETHSSGEATIQVQVNPVGNATIVKRVTYDLSNSSQKQEFEKLSNNSSDMYNTHLSDYREKMQSIADRTSYTQFEEVQLVTRKSEGVGRVFYVAKFKDLAETRDKDKKIVLTALKGAEFDSRMVILAPQAHYVHSATPTPSGGEIKNQIRAIGYDNPKFDNSFKVVFARIPVEQDSGENTTTSQPVEKQDNSGGIASVVSSALNMIAKFIPGSYDLYVIEGVLLLLIASIGYLVYRRRRE